MADPITDEISRKIQGAVEGAIKSASGRIIHEETEKAVTNIRRRLAAEAAEVATQVCCQLIPEKDHYQLTITLPGGAVAKTG
jgi:hypothetical protein